MEKYNLIIYPKVYLDLDNIYSNIIAESFSLNQAIRKTNRIWQGILSLNEFPESHQERFWGRYSKKGYRQLIVDNYIVIFKVDKDVKTVNVVAVQHHGQE